MSYKLIGAFLIIVGCGSIGFRMARERIMLEKNIRYLLSALDHMLLELQYHFLPISKLLRLAAEKSGGMIKKLLLLIAEEVDSQIAPDAECCIRAALAKVGKLPHQIRLAFEKLGAVLGNYDIEGQVKSLEAVRKQYSTILEDLMNNKDSKIRGYQTLGLCAGAAVAILLI